MRGRFGATNPRAQHLRFHTQTGGSTLTAQQPDNNIVRVALQALSAVLGGTQSLHCNGRDEALALPTEDAARLALRTQQIIAAETGVANTVDPVGGSWAIEERTDAIETEARALLAKIDAAGGTLAAIEAGQIQRQVQDAAYAAQLRVDRGESIVVGVNRFVTDERSPIEVMQLDPEGEARQAASVKAMRDLRDAHACTQALDALARAAAGVDNLVPHVLTAVEAHATLGEISDTLRGVFGEHREVHV
jgi:methylmalonyl-CoA mutase N-terminal domain/subunit